MAGLTKTLGVARGTALMLNIVLGAGLLTLPGLAYRMIGSDALWMWMLCALVAIPLLTVFAMIGRHFPDAGGIPALAKRQFGMRGYTAGTFLLLGAVALGLPAIAVTGGYYASGLVAASPYLLGGVLVILATAVNFLSAELAGRVNGIVASLLVFALIGLVVLGGLAVEGRPDGPVLAPPLLDHSTATYAAAFVMVFFAFTGWEIAAHLSEEFHDPLRDVPRAMLLSFVIAVGFYLGLAFIVGKSGLDGNFESPFAAIFANHYGAAAGRAVAAVAIVLIFANLSAAIWAVSRMVFSAAREGLLPASLASTRGGTPIRAVLAVVGTLLGAIALAAGGILPLQALLEYSGQNFLILYGVAAAVLFFARPDGGTRLVAGLALLAVLGILALRDPGALLYPLALVAISFLVSRALDRPQRNGLARPAEVPPDTAPQEGR